MSANEMQVGGEHYRNKDIQPWDYIVSNGLGYLEGCVVKYVSRHTTKGGVEDLLKARHYLDKLIETSTAAQGKVIDEMFEKKDNGIVVLKARKPKAPYGYKADGTPKKRPGRPRKV